MKKRIGKKTKLFLILIIFFLLLFEIAFIVSKSYINNNGKSLIGRTINLSSLRMNYLSGAVNIDDLLIYEDNDLDTFFYANSIHVNPNVLALIAQNYIIENIEIDQLITKVVLTDSIYNFNSIISFFADTTDTEVIDTTASDVDFRIENISLLNSSIEYQDNNINSNLGLNNLNVRIPSGIGSKSTDILMLTDFGINTGGALKSLFSYNLENKAYEVALKISALNLQVGQAYIEDVMFINEVGGALDCDLSLKGNTEETSDVDVHGNIVLSELFLSDTLDRKIISTERLQIEIDTINPAKDIYEINHIKVDLPYMLYEMYTLEDDNISRLLKNPSSTDSVVVTKSESNASNVFVMIKDYAVETLRDVKASNFSIDTVEISKVKLQYIDHSMLQRFEYLVSEANINAYAVDSDSDSLITTINALLNNKGRLEAKARLNPSQPEDLTVHLTIDELAMQDLSPYFHQYVAYPVQKGSFNMSCKLIIEDHQLHSSNQLIFKAFNLGKKQKHSEAYNLPVKVAVSMLKDRKGNIPLDLLVEGDLEDPSFKVWKTVGKIFKELMLKAVTSPYRVIAGESTELSKRISLKSLTDPLSDKQLKKLDHIASILAEKRDLRLSIEPNFDLAKETEALALIFSKADFLSMDKEQLNIENLKLINNLDVKDSLYVSFMNEANHSDTDQDIQVQVRHYIKQTSNNIKSYLISKSVNASQVKILNNSETSKGDIHYRFEIDAE